MSTEPPSVARLPLHGREGRGLHTLVDPDVYAWARGSRWYMNVRGYVFRHRDPQRRNHRRTARLHNLILPPGPGQVVDHINRNPLDNRRANLRLVTPAENAMNRGSKPGVSSYRGVTQGAGRWEVRIRTQNVRLHLGYYGRAEEAAYVYDLFALLLMQDLAQTNFPRARYERRTQQLRVLLGLQGPED